MRLGASLVIMLIAGAQGTNFFLKGPYDDEYMNGALELEAVTNAIFQQHPEARIIYYSHELLRGSYILLRYRNKELYAEKFRNRQLGFIYEESRPSVKELLTNYDYLVEEETYPARPDLEKLKIKSVDSWLSHRRAKIWILNPHKPLKAP